MHDHPTTPTVTGKFSSREALEAEVLRLHNEKNFSPTLISQMTEVERHTVRDILKLRITKSIDEPTYYITQNDDPRKVNINKRYQEGGRVLWLENIRPNRAKQIVEALNFKDLHTH